MSIAAFQPHDPAASKVTDLLPPNADLFEKGLAEGMSDGRLPVPIREVVNPATSPAGFLPWLAFHDSVDLWFDDWPEARKREVITYAITDAALKGTRAGIHRFLGYVDASVIDAISYPKPFLFGQAIIGRTPVGHQAFVGRYLVRVNCRTKPRAFIFGRAILGRARLKSPDLEPYRRVAAAMRVAKAPETQYRLDFAYKRVIRLSDNIPIDGTYRLGQYVDRTKL